MCFPEVRKSKLESIAGQALRFSPTVLVPGTAIIPWTPSGVILEQS